MSFAVTAYEHVGIRVTDRARAVAFYEALGWREEIDLPEHSANEMVNPAGVRINLIFNAAPEAGEHNVLQDQKEKLPGITHVAFVVDTLIGLIAALAKQGIAISEGPVEFADRRRTIFIRDPDRNVLEFNELARPA